jgi:hypothetical protein
MNHNRSNMQSGIGMPYPFLIREECQRQVRIWLRAIYVPRPKQTTEGYEFLYGLTPPKFPSG